MTESWIPGFAVVEGPARTGIALRYRGYREEDIAPAWIRVDAFPPNDLRAALTVARIYQATAALDHPELPHVLGYGNTLVAGRPFIAFQRMPPVQEHGFPAPAPEELAEILASIHLRAYERGLAGVHVPIHELNRIARGRRSEGRRLPIREFLAEPRVKKGPGAFMDVLPTEEWAQFAAPEFVRPKKGGALPSVRRAMPFRLGAQLRKAIPALERLLNEPEGPGSESIGQLLDLTRRSLDWNSARRPSLEDFF